MSKKRKSFEPVTCLRCGHGWTPQVPDPERCPKCRTFGWRSPPPAPAPEPQAPPAPPAPEPIEEPKEEIVENPTPILTTRREAEVPTPKPSKRELKRQDKLQKKEEKMTAKEAAKRERRERKVRAEEPRGKVSEKHPGAYELAATILPRSPILLLLIGLTISALSSMMIGNYLFVMDWYEKTVILPWFMSIFTYSGGPGAWFEDYWPLVALLGCLAMSLIFVIWSLPWRFAFKDYIVIRGNTKSKDGRIMWSTDNVWTRIWDRIYGTPPRTTVELWLKHRFWWNPLMPQKGLVKLTLDREVEKPRYDGLFSYTAEERRYRMYTAYDEMVTTDDAQQSMPIPLSDVNANFASRGQLLVKDTQKFSLANPQVRLEKLKQGTHIVPQDLKEAAEVARANRGEG